MAVEAELGADEWVVELKGGVKASFGFEEDPKVDASEGETYRFSDPPIVPEANPLEISPNDKNKGWEPEAEDRG